MSISKLSPQDDIPTSTLWRSLSNLVIHIYLPWNTKHTTSKLLGFLFQHQAWSYSFRYHNNIIAHNDSNTMFPSSEKPISYLVDISPDINTYMGMAYYAIYEILFLVDDGVECQTNNTWYKYLHMTPFLPCKYIKRQKLETLAHNLLQFSAPTLLIATSDIEGPS